jgi:hypothetical protein
MGISIICYAVNDPAEAERTYSHEGFFGNLYEVTAPQVKFLHEDVISIKLLLL